MQNNDKLILLVVIIFYILIITYLSSQQQRFEIFAEPNIITDQNINTNSRNFSSYENTDYGLTFNVVAAFFPYPPTNPGVNIIDASFPDHSNKSLDAFTSQSIDELNLDFANIKFIKSNTTRLAGFGVASCDVFFDEQTNKNLAASNPDTTGAFFGFYYRAHGGYLGNMAESILYNSTTKQLSGYIDYGVAPRKYITKELSDSEEKKLEQLIIDNRFFKIPNILRNPMFDGLNPCLTVRIDNNTHTVEQTGFSLQENDSSIADDSGLWNIINAIRQHMELSNVKPLDSPSMHAYYSSISKL